MNVIALPMIRPGVDPILAGRLSGKRAFVTALEQFPELTAPAIVLLDFEWTQRPDCGLVCGLACDFACGLACGITARTAERNVASSSGLAARSDSTPLPAVNPKASFLRRVA